MEATIRYSEDRDHFEFKAPGDEDFFELTPVPEEGCMTFIDDDDPNRQYFVTFYNYHGDLEPDTVYRLTAEDTQIEDGADDEDEDEEEDEEAADVTSVTGNGNHG